MKNLHTIDLFRPLVFGGIVVALFLAIGGWTVAYTVDEGARSREEMLISNGIAGKILEIDASVLPQVVWDEALQHLEAGDLDWAANNIGTFLHQAAGFEYSFVMDHQNRIFYASRDGKAAATEIYGKFAGAMHQSVAKVRAIESRHGHRSGAGLSDAVQAHTIALVDGKPYIAVASLVEPDFGTVKQQRRHAPVVVAALPMDDAFLATFGKRYLTPDIALSLERIPVRRGVGRVELLDDRGSPVATLHWAVRKPGTSLIAKLAVPVLVGMALCIAVMISFYRRSNRAAQALIASEARASHLAYHDPLTGLPNRVMFFDRLGVALDQMRRHGTAVAVHCLDLDRFKEVNDTYGHQTGDELIEAVARRIADVCRKSDTFARLSGDEFAIVQLDATPMAASRLADRVVKAMAEPIELSTGRLHISCSLGVNLITEGEVSATDAHRHADLALYRAKQNGRAQFCFFEAEMDIAMRMRRELEADLREALSNGELHMLYQPQSDKNGRITGVEALLRWSHPKRGEISPSMFVPIAEECGLIHRLGLFTLREAFQASRQWRGLKVAINISATQLRMRDFADRVAELLAECKVDARGFELEITEGLLLGDDPVTHQTLMRLRDMGFSIALDDFGTGYSSLSYLHRYPIDKIKIDRSFVANLGVENEAQAVVQAIVKLARSLRLNVIAEGVETSEQQDYLTAVGCEEIQGYLYSRPVEPEAITQMRAKGGIEQRVKVPASVRRRAA